VMRLRPFAVVGPVRPMRRPCLTAPGEGYEAVEKSKMPLVLREERAQLVAEEGFGLASK